MSDPYLPQGTTTTNSGLADNLVAGLCYLFGILALIFLFIDPYKNRPFVRFACLQVIFTYIGFIVCGILMIIPYVRYVAILAYLVLGVCYFIAMVMAFLSKTFKIPVIGNLAEKYAGTSAITTI